MPYSYAERLRLSMMRWFGLLLLAWLHSLMSQKT
jgi:hypothetical protein